MAKASSTRLGQFGTVRFMTRSLMEIICQAFTTWFHGKATPKKKTLRSLHRLSNTFRGSSSSTIWSIRRNRKRLHLQLIPLHRWQSQQSSKPTKKSVADRPRPKVLTNALKKAEDLIFTSFLALFLLRQKTPSLSYDLGASFRFFLLSRSTKPGCFFEQKLNVPFEAKSSTSLDFPLQFSYWVWGVFHRSILEFLSRFSFKVSEVFSHQIRKDKFFLLVVFSTTFHYNSYQPPHARRSLRLRGEAIGITCSHDQATWQVLALVPSTSVLRLDLARSAIPSGLRSDLQRTELNSEGLGPLRVSYHLSLPRSMSSHKRILSLNAILQDIIDQCHPFRSSRTRSQSRPRW